MNSRTIANDIQPTEMTPTTATTTYCQACMPNIACLLAITARVGPAQTPGAFCLTRILQTAQGLVEAYTYTATGSLGLQLTNVTYLGLRIRWKDGKRQRLEDCLGPFIAHLGVVTAAMKAERAQRQQEARERAQRERRREEEQERRRAQQERLERLVKEAATWRQASELRAYAETGLRFLNERSGLGEADEARRADLIWLLEYSERIDPLHAEFEPQD